MADPLAELLDQVRRGLLDPQAAAVTLRERLAQPLGFATVDHDRPHRCGAAEVIFAQNKTPGQVAAIVAVIRRHHPACLVTRATAEHRAAIREQHGHDVIEVGSRGSTVLIGAPPPPSPNARSIAIVTAGTSDEPVAEEAELTCKTMSQPTVRINDVGVAGLHRLGARMNQLREAAVIICIAGMEGALPSVVGGLVKVPVIAVPTSVGYGAAFGGVAALLGMLTSCAAGVAVVNIDNGFGAAHTACLFNQLLTEAKDDRA